MPIIQILHRLIEGVNNSAQGKAIKAKYFKIKEYLFRGSRWNRQMFRHARHRWLQQCLLTENLILSFRV